MYFDDLVTRSVTIDTTLEKLCNSKDGMGDVTINLQKWPINANELLKLARRNI